MSFRQMLKMVFMNIRGNKLRSFLTTLGVIVGTATIFLVVAIGAGAEAQVNEQYSKLNVGSIFVMAQGRGTVADPLTVSDAEAFEESENIEIAYPMLRGNTDIKYMDYATSGTVTGLPVEAQEYSHLTVSSGRLLEQDDDNRMSRVVVLGYEIADTITDGDPDSALGQTVNIQSRRFEVVGIITYQGDSGGFGSYDDSVFIPYTVAERMIFGASANPMITAQATSIDTVDAAIEDITASLDENHRLGGSEQFRIRDAGSQLVSAQETASTMSTLLLSVAAVVLVVSGIGIMNVMFVTVKERTREIGTLKALGARKKEILSQFLMEAVIISLLGGVIGVILGFGTLPLASMTGMYVLPSLNGVFLGLLFSMFTGITFGYYPAKNAAELNPIDALRYE